MQKQNVETLEYSTEYQPKEIISNLINQKKNYHVIKDRTGSGATYGICNLDSERIILLSPTVQLVKDKERQYIQGHFSKTNIKFYYGSSKNRIADCVPVTDGGHLVMGTVDQLVYMKINDFVNAGYTLIIDELHLDVMGSLFRTKLNEPFINLTQQFKNIGGVITITATPLHIYPDVFNDFNIVKLIKYQGVKKTVLVTHSLRDFKQFVDDIHIDGKRLLFFSNDDGMLTKMAKRFEDKKILVILGNTLKVKNLVKFGDLNELDSDVILASSAAMEGLDIDLTGGTIVIHNRYNTDFGLFTTQTMLQALGRIRSGYDNALIFLDETIDMKELEPLEIVKTNMVCVAEENKRISVDIINNIAKFKKEFEKYNYTIMDEDIFTSIRGVDTFNGCTASIGMMVRNINSITETDFNFNLKQVMNNVHINNRFYGFSPKIAFGFLIAGILKNTECNVDDVLNYIDDDKLGDGLVKFRTLLEDNGFLKNKFSNNNERNLPNCPHISYKIFEPNSVGYVNFGEADIIDIFSNTQNELLKTLLEKFEMMVYTQYPTRGTKGYINKHVEDSYLKKENNILLTVNKFILTKYFKVLSKCNKKTTTDIDRNRANIVVELLNKISDEEINFQSFKQIVIKNFNNNDFFNLKETGNIEKFIINEGSTTLLNEIKKFGLLFVREFKTGLFKKDNREYSAVTTLPINILGQISPRGILEFDITEAYPTFVNAIVEYTQTGTTIYNNIMINLKVDRPIAKTMYNTMLNAIDTNIPNKYRLDFFINCCGYTQEQANNIIGFNIKKGDAFRLFASIEKEVVSDIESKIKWEYRDYTMVRRHDSLVVVGATSTIKEMEVDTLYNYNGKEITLKTKVHITKK